MSGSSHGICGGPDRDCHHHVIAGDPAPLERVLFALVANRALDPCSKLAATRWIGEVVHIPGLIEVDEDSCYRVMDLLVEIEDELAQQVFWQVATLLDLEVDPVLFDSTSTYGERDTADDPVTRDSRGEPVPADSEEGVRLGGFRTWGHSKDHRPDRPQVVIGMAVTRGGIPSPSHATDRLVPCLPRSTGLRPDTSPPQGDLVIDPSTERSSRSSPIIRSKASSEIRSNA